MLVHGTRRFIIRKPTCDTIARLTSGFALEITALHTTYHEAGQAGSELLAVALPLFLSDLPRAARVLDSCVELWQGAPGELGDLVSADRPLAQALTVAVLGLSDVPRLCRLLGLDQPPDEAEPGLPEEISEPFDLMLGAVADHFATDPFVVMGWPFEAVHSLLSSVIPQLNALKAGKLGAAQPMASSGPGIEDLAAGGFGIAYHKAPPS